MKWEVKVTNVQTRLRVRTGPSTSYKIVNYKYPGNTGIVVDTKTVGRATWYKWEGTSYWSCAKTAGGTEYLAFVRDLEPAEEPKEEPEEPKEENNDPPYVYEPIDFGDPEKYNNRTGNSVDGWYDWYAPSSIKYSDVNYSVVDDDTIMKEIARLKYNMDISYSAKDDIYNDIQDGYVTDLQAKMHHSFNRNKITYPDKELSKTFAYVFFTRPDLNILDYGVVEPGKFSINSNSAADPKYSYIFNNNSNTLRSLVKNGNPNHDFLVFLSNEARSFEVEDIVLKTYEHGETYNGSKIIYGRTDHDSNSSGEMDIRYVDNVNLDIFKMHLLWVDYISKVSRGVFVPKEEYIKNRILDYACSCYYFLCGPDGNTILYWQKLTGVFPMNTGENAFSWDSGTLLASPEINIKYAYSMRTSMDVFHLDEFNKMTRKDKITSFKNIYSKDIIQTGSTLTHCPWVWRTKDPNGNAVYRLMWFDPGVGN